MTILRKDHDDGGLALTIPGTPPTAPTPAYCIDVVTVVQGTDTVAVMDDDGNLVLIPVSTGPRPVLSRECFPAAPGSPGTPPIEIPAVEADYYIGWNASANSIASLTGAGMYQFTVDTNAVGVVTGFNSQDTGSGYVEIEHGIYCTNGEFQVIENGFVKTAPATFASSDEFTIRRLGGEVAYFKGTTKVYTSTVRSTETVFVDASLFFGSDQILSASLSTTVDAAYAASGDGVGEGGNDGSGGTQGAHGMLRGLHGFATDSTIGSGGGVGSDPTSGGGSEGGGGPGTDDGVDSNGDWPGRVGGILRNLVGVAESYNNGTVDTGGGEGSGGDGALPNGDFIGRSGNQLRGLVGESYGSSDPLGDGDPGEHYATCAGLLNDPTSDSSGIVGASEGGMLTPQFAVAHGLLMSVSGFSIAINGSNGVVEGQLGHLLGFAANTEGAEVRTDPDLAPGGGSVETTTTLFSDDFSDTGTPANPDVGGAYASDSGDLLSNYSEGSGVLPTTTEAGSNEIKSALTDSPTGEYTFEVSFTPTDVGSDTVTVDLSGIVDGDANYSVEATLSWNGTDTWSLFVYVADAAGNELFSDTVDVTGQITEDVATSLGFTVSENGTSFTIGGTEVASTTEIPATPDTIGFSNHGSGATTNIDITDITVVDVVTSAGGGNDIEIDSNGDWNERLGGYLRSLIGAGYDSEGIVSSGYLVAEIPSPFTIFAVGDTPTVLDPEGNPTGYGLRARVPFPTFRGSGAGILHADVPTITFSGAATASSMGGLNQFTPFPTFRGAATSTVLGSLHATFKCRVTLRGYGAGSFRGEVPFPTFSGRARATRVGGLSADVPFPTFSGAGTVSVLGRLSAQVPMPRRVSGGVLVATVPMFTLRAIGGDTTAAEYEAYSLTLVPTDNGETVAASRYTNYPFDRIVRFGDTYYGVAADGLYELDGDDFDGAAIVSEVTFPAHDFKKPNLKRGRMLHLAGRIGADLEVSVTLAQGNTPKTYKYRPASQRSGAHNHRVPIGRGLEARYWSFSLSNTKGEDFALAEMTPELDVLTRTIWD